MPMPAAVPPTQKTTPLASSFKSTSMVDRELLGSMKETEASNNCDLEGILPTKKVISWDLTNKNDDFMEFNQQNW